MIKLNDKFTSEEIKALNKWKDSKLLILSELNEKCYLLNQNGKLSYEECFDRIDDDYFNSQRYNLAKPKHVIKYYHYYLLKNDDGSGDWFVGEMQKNGNIEFSACSETLEDAFNSL